MRDLVFSLLICMEQSTKLTIQYLILYRNLPETHIQQNLASIFLPVMPMPIIFLKWQGSFIWPEEEFENGGAFTGLISEARPFPTMPLFHARTLTGAGRPSIHCHESARNLCEAHCTAPALRHCIDSGLCALCCWLVCFVKILRRHLLRSTSLAVHICCRTVCQHRLRCHGVAQEGVRSSGSRHARSVAPAHSFPFHPLLDVQLLALVKSPIFAHLLCAEAQT